MKRILATILMVTMLLCSLSAPVSAETDAYANAIKNLYLYMKHSEDSGQDIKDIIRDFTLLSNEGFSAELMIYSMMVQYIIVNDDLATAELYANALDQMTAFTDYIEAETDGLNDYMRRCCDTSDGTSGIVPVWRIKAYIAGRRAEDNGEMDEAREKYLQCINFYDAQDRMIMTLEQQNVIDKDAIFKEAMELYGRGELEKAAQELFKIKDIHMAAGALYEVVINELIDNAEALIPEITLPPEPTLPPQVSISTPKATTKPRYTSKPKTTSKPAATSKPEVTSKPTVTAAPAPVLIYSDWVADVPTGARVVDTKTQYRRRGIATEYRYRDLSTKTSTESSLGDGWSQVKSELVYGEWSAYTETPISASSTLEVEQATKEVSKEVTVWNYSRWEYKNVDYPKLLYYSCVDYSKQNPAKVAEAYGWKYTSSTTRFTNLGKQGGCVKYKSASGATWYNESSSTKTETEQVTVYRSRTKTMKYTYQKWGSWSDWSKNSVGESSTRQVETRRSYGNWSAWQDDKLDANGGEVQTRTMYRYLIQG